jgi:phosphohistidine phosphatase
MKIVIIRHAIAMARDEWAEQSANDDLRPVTGEGEKRMRRGAKGLKGVVKRLDIIATSPLLRARQTAQIIADALGGPAPTEVAQLVPNGGAESVTEWLQGQPSDATIAVVGHEPDLSALMAWLTTANPRAFMPLKKGGACLLEADDVPIAGNCQLRWALTPAQLRDLAT